jgi:hypothetical protein
MQPTAKDAIEELAASRLIPAFILRRPSKGVNHNVSRVAAR